MSREKGRGELGTRLIFGPLMLGIVALIYYLDYTGAIAGAKTGALTAAVLGLLAVGGILEYVAMFKHAGFPVADKLLPPPAEAPPDTAGDPATGEPAPTPAADPTEELIREGIRRGLGGILGGDSER